jgi:hypothetical protein
MTSKDIALFLLLTAWPLMLLAFGMLVDQVVRIRQEWSR